MSFIETFAGELSLESNPSGLVFDADITQSSDIYICYNDRLGMDLNISLSNSGTDTLRSLQFGWFQSSDQKGSYNWGGVLAPGEVENVSVTQIDFLNPGTYTISLWLFSDVGNMDASNDSITISIHIAPPFVVDELHDTTICTNTSTSMSVPSVYSSYLWSSGEVVNQLTISDSGQYFVTITDLDGCEAIDSFVLQLHQAPSSLLPGDTIICDGVILNPTGPIGFSSYSWSNGDLTTDTFIDHEGDYQLIVTDTFGCSYTDTLNVQYLALPNPGVPPTIILCPGDSTTLNASSNYNTYLWSNGASGSSIVINTPGLYYVTVTGTGGCVGVDTVEVLMNPEPLIEFYDSVMCNMEPMMMDIGWFAGFEWSNGAIIQNPIINTPGLYSVTVTDGNGCESIDSIEIINYSVAVSLGADTTICAGGVLYLYLGVYDSYLWNDGETGGTHWVGSGGVYSVTVTNGLCAAHDDLLVTELPKPIADFSEYVVSPGVEFTNMSNVSVNLSWDFGDQLTSNAENPIHIYANPGIYLVKLTAANICDTSTYSNLVSVYPQSGINITGDESLHIYPTITSTLIKFTLEDLNAKEIKYVVYDVTGKLLIDKKVIYHGADFEYQIDVSQFATATYYLSISADGETRAVQPFVKR